MPPLSPLADPVPFATPAQSAACRELIRTGSRSFHAASHFLPEDAREGAYALYGFCRLSDDVVDGAARDADAIAGLHARLDAIYAGSPADNAVDPPLADVVRRYAVPRVAFDALLEGFAWDLAGRGYETEDDLDAYAARVAGSVGVMMAALMGARSPQQLARACDLGVAMQYTNIARDVGEDSRAGRLYLPRAWMRAEGLDPVAFLEMPAFSPALGRVIARVLARADDLYRRADQGIARLPRRFQPAIRAARLLYAGIGAEVARRGHDSVSGRARVGALRKITLMARALTPANASEDGAAAPLAATSFLVDAALACSAPAPARRTGGDMDFVIGLFDRLERRKRAHAVTRRASA